MRSDLPAKDAVDLAIGRNLFNRMFLVLLCYYWAIQFIKGDQVELLSPEISYYFFVIPAAAFGVGAALYMFATSARLNAQTTILAAFVVAIVLVSLYRADFRTIASVGLLGITLLSLFQIPLRVPMILINILFLGAIAITSILYYFDYGIYTFVPGINASPLWWRISAYPSVAEGGLFAMTVFVMNLAIRHGRYRIPMLWISGYMCVFSGSRTGIAIMLFCLLYVVLERNRFIKNNAHRAFFVSSVFIIFMISIFFSDILLALPFTDTQFLQTIIFREEAIRFDVGDQLGTAAVRQWIFEQHLAAFWENPLVGIGTFDLRMLTTGYEALDNAATGSEAFVTGLLARIGLLSVLLFAALLMTRRGLSPREADLATCCKVALILGMAAYGSFVNVYDIVFLLLILGIAGGIAVPAPRQVSGRSERIAKGGVPVV